MHADSPTIAVFGEALVDDFITEQVVGGASPATSPRSGLLP